MSACCSRQIIQSLRSVRVVSRGTRHQRCLTAIASSSSSITPHVNSSSRSSTSTQVRYLSRSARVAAPETKERPKRVQDDSRFNFNTSVEFSEDPDPEHVNYRRVTAAELTNRREAPTKVTMLVRDFIDDSLYNPHYGYFSHKATIFTPPDEGYEFSSFRNQDEFEETIGERYSKEYGKVMENGLGRQVWHTPTELFKPYYAQALTSAILASYKLNHFPYQDLIIYELGAGNGSFMIDALKYIQSHHPDVYARTKYRIVEISPQLAQRQTERAKRAGVEESVEIVQIDIFKWNGGGVEPCYVVALEVLDNFAHDMVRYDLRTLEPLQAIVVIDGSGDFSLLYESVTDPLLRRVLSYRHLLPPSSSTRPPVSAPLAASATLRKAFAALPFAPNLSKPEFIMTKAVLLLERLRTQLPQHRLMVADFSSLPDAVPGRNGPVVQTRVNQVMVPCETFLVKHGCFDIFFPTDFELLRDIYSVIMNSPPFPLTASSSHSHHPPTYPPFPSSPTSLTSQVSSTITTPTALRTDFFSHSVKGFRRRSVGIYPQSEFIKRYGGEEIVKRLTMKDGTSLVESMYGNAKVMF